jgi:hypothetical protein
MEEWPPIWGLSVYILNKQLTRGSPPVGLGEVLITSCKNWPCYETGTWALDLD